MNTNCLNCSSPVTDSYCPRCGQKTDTHRITLKHFIFHDLLHGVWHIDKGILFTVKQAIVRPGNAALDYINGKRQPYYNVFYLSLLLIAITLVFNNFIDIVVPETPEPNESAEKFQNYQQTAIYLKQYVRLLIFAVVPVFALNAWLIFKKPKLNFAEHCIIAGMCLLGILVINLVYLLFYLLSGMTGYTVFSIFEAVSVIPILAFPVYTYFGAFRKHYTLAGYSWRITLFYILFMIQGILITRYIYFLVTGRLSVFGYNF